MVVEGTEVEGGGGGGGEQEKSRGDSSPRPRLVYYGACRRLNLREMTRDLNWRHSKNRWEGSMSV